jgi:hypothetical protein
MPRNTRVRRAGIGVAAVALAAAALVAGSTQAQANGNATPSSVAALTGGGPYAGLLAGAPVSFTEYEAENARTNGAIVGPDRAFTQLAAEASGRRAVRLSGPGAYIEFTLARAANALDIRYAVPDGTDGARLGVYVNGQRVGGLTLTSRYSYAYGNYPYTNDPADGGAHHYFDDARTRLSRTVPAGTSIRLQVEPDATAAWYVIDVADFETVSPAPRPDGYLSVTDFGADPTGAADSSAALQAALDAGRQQQRGVWIPTGTFTVTRQLRVDRVTVRGAGPWYSVLSGAGVGVFGNPAPNPSTAVHLADFAIFGDTTIRNDQTSDSGLGGSLGGGSTVDNVWIEHTKVGAWFDGPSDGLSLSRLRIQNVWADGINLHNGVSNTVVQDSFVRNAGDDGMAMWSDQNADHDNAFNRNTVIAPLLANAYAIYGGHDNAITGNVGADTVTQGGGAHVANRFGAVALSGTTTVARNLFARTGDLVPNFPTTDSAIWLWAQDAPITGRVDITRNVALDSSYAALQFVGSRITDVHVDDLVIAGTGTFAVQLQAAGSAEFSRVVATGVGTAGVYDCDSGFVIDKIRGNDGWGTAQCGFPPMGQLAVTPDVIAFGDQAIGVSARRPITITNPGPAPITITGATPPAGFTLDDHCASLAVGASCTIDVVFTPATPNLFTGQVTVYSTSPAGLYLVALSGLGLDPNGNLALGHPITSSSRAADYFGPAKANDGDQASYFESQNNAWPQTLTVDLTAVRAIGSVVLQLPTNWGARVETVEVQVSTDGATYTTVVPAADYLLDPATGNSVTVAFPATPARFVRLVATNNTGWPAMQFSEFQVWAAQEPL